MRVVRTFAAFVALATVAFAVGDLASHPNALGAIGILLLIAAFAFLLSYLFRTPGEPAEKPPPAPRERKPPRRAPAAGVWAEGWDAGEADASRERRREKPRG